MSVTALPRPGRCQVSTIVGEFEDTQRATTRALHLSIRDQAIPLLRSMGDDWHRSAEVARRLKIQPAIVGRVLNRFPTYFVTVGGTRDNIALLVRLHPHLVAP